MASKKKKDAIFNEKFMKKMTDSLRKNQRVRVRSLIKDKKGKLLGPAITDPEVRQELKKTTHPKQHVDKVAQSKRKRKVKAGVKRGSAFKFTGSTGVRKSPVGAQKVKAAQAETIQGRRTKAIEEGKIKPRKRVKLKEPKTTITEKGRGHTPKVSAGPQNKIPGAKPPGKVSKSAWQAIKEGARWVKNNPKAATKAGLKKVLKGAGLAETALAYGLTVAWKEGRKVRDYRQGQATKGRALKRVSESERRRKGGTVDSITRALEKEENAPSKKKKKGGK